MKKITLVVMAAGMGSRYGGLKQIDSIGPNGEIILELSVKDALAAGFDRIVFVIKKAIEEDFKKAVLPRMPKGIEIDFVYQEVDDPSLVIEVPKDRVKPWGTGHVITCLNQVVNEPFGIINSDDYYGKESFCLLSDFLKGSHDAGDYCMVAYMLENTLSENGTVARGLCRLDRDKLADVKETLKIGRSEGKVVSYEEDGSIIELDPQSPVSMNMWGFMPDFIDKSIEKFIRFQKEEVPLNPLKSECYIPKIVDSLIHENRCHVTVLKTTERWAGVTYQQDKPAVREFIRKVLEKEE